MFTRRKARTYGNQDTIHQTTELDVEVRNGRVVAVWFRCQPLPFQQVNVDAHRASAMVSMYGSQPAPDLLAVDIVDSITRP